MQVMSGASNLDNIKFDAELDTINCVLKLTLELFGLFVFCLDSAAWKTTCTLDCQQRVWVWFQWRDLSICSSIQSQWAAFSGNTPTCLDACTSTQKL